VLAGAILGNLLMVLQLVTDPNPDRARQGLIYGVLGAVVSGTILASTLFLTCQKRSGLSIGLSVVGAALAGVTYSLALIPLAESTGIPGFNIWSLAGILVGGSAGMMLGLSIVPTPPFVGGNIDKNPKFS